MNSSMPSGTELAAEAGALDAAEGKVGLRAAGAVELNHPGLEPIGHRRRARGRCRTRWRRGRRVCRWPVATASSSRLRAEDDARPGRRSPRGTRPSPASRRSGPSASRKAPGRDPVAAGAQRRALRRRPSRPGPRPRPPRRSDDSGGSVVAGSAGSPGCSTPRRVGQPVDELVVGSASTIIRFGLTQLCPSCACARSRRPRPCDPGARRPGR